MSLSIWWGKKPSYNKKNNSSDNHYGPGPYAFKKICFFFFDDVQQKLVDCSAFQ